VGLWKPHFRAQNIAANVLQIGGRFNAANVLLAAVFSLLLSAT